MMTTATKVLRAVVMRRAQYNGVPAYGQAPQGSLIPWQANLERLVALGYVAKQEVEADALRECPHCAGLEFRDDKLLEEHVAQDQKRIAELQVTIPHLEATAKRLDQEAKDLRPRSYEHPLGVQGMKNTIANSAQSARDDAAKFKRELESITGEQE